MEVGGSIEEECQKVFLTYQEILKERVPTRDEDNPKIFIFIPPFQSVPIREVTEELAKQVD
jgi:hypothetical protein